MLNQLIAYLGQPEKVVNHEHIFQCPICRDNGRDNLKYNEVKNVVTCFADPDHAKEILRQIGKEKYKQDGTISNTERPPKKEVDKSWFLEYFCKVSEELLKDEKALKFLEDKRGITKKTVQFCGIGFDREKKRWVFPVFSLDGLLEGFEYRPANLLKFSTYEKDGKICGGEKCKKEPGTPAILSSINCCTPEKEILVIIEGFIDGYVFMQHQQDKKNDKLLHVVTPSNGVGTTLPSIRKADISKYKQVILFLDNDEPKFNPNTNKWVAPGPDNVKKILEEYPNFTSQVLSCGCKDFGDHYLKCIKKREGEAK